MASEWGRAHRSCDLRRRRTRRETDGRLQTGRTVTDRLAEWGKVAAEARIGRGVRRFRSVWTAISRPGATSARWWCRVRHPRKSPRPRCTHRREIRSRPMSPPSRPPPRATRAGSLQHVRGNTGIGRPVRAMPPLAMPVVRTAKTPPWRGFFVTYQCRAVWWLWVDSNHRPRHYECRALTG